VPENLQGYKIGRVHVEDSAAGIAAVREDYDRAVTELKSLGDVSVVVK